MRLENIVCSREWSERLKEGGWPQEAFFWWCNAITGREGYRLLETRVIEDMENDGEEYHPIAAPTASELGMVIALYEPTTPQSAIDRGTGVLHWFFNNIRYDTEPDARAAQVVWMLSQEIITPERIKEILK